jgi:hypothetical protein
MLPFKWARMKATTAAGTAEPFHCAVCGRELTEAELREVFGGGLLLCGYCRAEMESCGCGE